MYKNPKRRNETAGTKRPKPPKVETEPKTMTEKNWRQFKVYFKRMSRETVHIQYQSINFINEGINT
jgi:hypothetical protein